MKRSEREDWDRMTDTIKQSYGMLAERLESDDDSAWLLRLLAAHLACREDLRAMLDAAHEVELIALAERERSGL
jgi:hypothetical protein